MTHPLTPRDKVARIVDPWAFSIIANITQTERAADNRAKALTKADAIIEAIAPSGDQLSGNPGILKSDDHAELARLAEAATPGPWVSERSVDEWGVSVIASNETGHISNPTRGQVCHVSVVAGASGDDPDLAQANAAFIAAANPATVLALIAEVAALRGDLDVARTDLDHLEVHFRQRDREATEAERKLAEAVGLLRDWMGTWFVDADSRGENAIADDTRKFLSKEAERG